MLYSLTSVRSLQTSHVLRDRSKGSYVLDLSADTGVTTSVDEPSRIYPFGGENKVL